jgi:hypothetical protein
MAISELRVSEQAVLISREIAQAPIKTVIRELVQNAIEAEYEYPTQNRKIDFYITPIHLNDGSVVDKLSIRNNGKGMTGQELKEITNLSASSHKRLGVGRNYGIGAKVSGLRSNPAGMRYRSCHNNIVSEVTLVEEDGVYGRVKDEDTNEDVFDATGEYQSDFLALNEDWTEVTLYGSNLTDNTLEKPFGDELEVTQNWLNVLVHFRYFRLPTSVSLNYAEGVLSKKQTRRTLKTWEQILQEKNQIKYETVDAGDGINITYALNTAKGWNVHQMALSACGALVYKGEMFDVASSKEKLITKKWGITAPKLGIPFGSESLCVFIELDEKLDIQMNMYRDKLIDRLGEEINLEHFSNHVYEFMPDWVKEFIDQERHKHRGSNSKFRDRVAEIIRQLNIQREQLRPNSDGIDLTDLNEGTNNQLTEQAEVSKSKNKKLTVANLGTSVKAKKMNGFENIPDWSIISEQSKLSEYELVSYAASYISGVTNQVYINGTHRNYTEKLTELEEEFPFEMKHEDGRELMIRLFNEEYAFNLVLTIIHAKYEWKKNKWDDEQLEEATSKSSLTTSISKDYGLIGAIKQRVKNNKEIKAIRASLVS